VKSRYWIVVVLLAIVGASPRAFAHAEFESSDPKQGDHLKKPPKTIVLAFTEPPSEEGRFEIKDGCRQDVIESARVIDKSVRADVKEGCPGKWTVDFRVISAVDAHVVSGQFTFHVAKKRDRPKNAATESPSDNPSPGLAQDGATGDEDGSGFPWFLVALGGGTLIGGALIARYLTKT
jgi:methionine-rich copper-binding protein CopC